METIIINGPEIANRLKSRLRDEVKALGLRPGLAILLIGDDEASRSYVRLKEKAAVDIGCQCRVWAVPADTEVARLVETIGALNAEPDTHGILVQLPLPGPMAERQESILASISPGKDVDGFHPFNRGGLLVGEARFVSCAALAVLEVIEQYGPVVGKHTVLIGDSFDLVQPLALLLLGRGCQVELIPVAREWEAPAGRADILVVEKGHPGMVTGDLIKPGAFIVDAGFYRESGQICGNVDTASVIGRAGWLAPVPGGIGPVLIAKLLENLVKAARSSDKTVR